MQPMEYRPDDNANRNWSAYGWDSHIGNTAPMRPVPPPAQQVPPQAVPQQPYAQYPLNQLPPEAYARDAEVDYDEFFYGRGTYEEQVKPARGGCGCGCGSFIAVLLAVALVFTMWPTLLPSQDIIRGAQIDQFRNWLTETFHVQWPVPSQEEFDAIYNQETRADAGYLSEDPSTELLSVADALNYYYIKTIHHEFTHILNQTKTYAENFGQITSNTYVGDACFDTDQYWRGRGYITDYAQSEHREDFAEMFSEYITHDAAWWQEQLDAAHSETANVRQVTPDAEYGDVLINAKMDIVRTYLQDSWGIDIDELRDILGRRFGDVVAGRVDLNSVKLTAQEEQ